MKAAWFESGLSRLIAAAVIFSGGAVLLAQNEPRYNPLLPAGVGNGTELGGAGVNDRSSGGGARLGRARGPDPEGGDANPADTLLRSIEGTNYGRYRGHAYFRGPETRRAQHNREWASSAARRNQPRSKASGDEYYGRRGDYERSLYAPSYRGARNRKTSDWRSALPRTYPEGPWY